MSTDFFKQIAKICQAMKEDLLPARSRSGRPLLPATSGDIIILSRRKKINDRGE